MEEPTVTSDERDLGFGHSTGDPYLTGNDDDSPDSPDVLETDPRPVSRDDGAEARAGSSVDDLQAAQVSGADNTGTEIFDGDTRESRGRAADQARIGDADFRTQEAVYHDYQERLSES